VIRKQLWIVSQNTESASGNAGGSIFSPIAQRPNPFMVITAPGYCFSNNTHSNASVCVRANNKTPMIQLGLVKLREEENKPSNFYGMLKY